MATGTADQALRELSRDAWIFVTSLALSPVSLSTPHIYVSALSFWPARRPVSRYYPQRRPYLISPTSTAVTTRQTTPIARLETQNLTLSVCYSPSGKEIAAGCSDNTVRIWDIRTGEPIGEPLRAHVGHVSSIAFSPDGRYLISGSWDATASVWDILIGKPVVQYKHHRSVTSVAWSPDPSHVISASHDGAVCVWNPQTGRDIAEPHRYDHTHITSVAFSPDGRHIAGGSADGAMHIWSVDGHLSLSNSIHMHAGKVYSVAYSPDGSQVASGCYDSTIRLWDTATGYGAEEPLKGHKDAVSSVVYSADGSYLISGSCDGTVRIWDLQHRKAIGKPLEGHTDTVHTVQFSRDGQYFISGSYDKTICVWEFDQLVQDHTETDLNPQSSTDADITRRDEIPPSRSYICDAGCVVDEPHQPWALDKEGWVIIEGSKRLAWVPSDLRKYLMFPEGLDPSSGGRILRLQFDHDKIGDHWEEHFRPYTLVQA
ncbi:WD40 repeat protein [Ceratobasidium sp. AG-Ba]|nr:WD40 repeat protein [Ceratobasidium sp. AG-Ba]QRV98535.1 WD40 repeat protein [Ceratobasidium sp. AG-Ba]